MRSFPSDGGSSPESPHPGSRLQIAFDIKRFSRIAGPAMFSINSIASPETARHVARKVRPLIGS